MSQRFIRCRHCGFPHDGSQIFCPATGQSIRGKTGTAKEGSAKDATAKEARAREATAKEEARVTPPPSPPASVAPSSRRGAPRTLVGKTIGGKYLVRRVLGEGGMGAVFEAEHIALARAVAVKVLHANQVSKKDAIRRFQHEARAAGATGHPNICGVIDVGTLEDGSPYMVMERLVGETLADRIVSEGGMAFDEVIDILVQVLSGLVAAHEQRIVHRDIKPENIFLTTRAGCPPLVKLLDFGVSKMMSEPGGASRPDLSLTRTGMVMGTPYYMAPEQARGERDIDARVDLYACGVIFYESITGKRPFNAANYNALLLQILSATPRPAAELRPALPAAYGAVIEKAMARKREDRYASAAAFQGDLKSLRDRHNPPRIGGALQVSPSPSERRSKAIELAPTSVEVPIASSVEIPITEGSDTGLFVVDPTEVHVRNAEGYRDERLEKKADVAGESGTHADDDGEPTQLMAPVHPRRR